MQKRRKKTHVSNVKSIQVVVFIGNRKEHGLLWIPRNSITLHIQFQLFHRLIGSYVIQNNRFIYSQSFQKCDLVENTTWHSCASQIGFDWVEFNPVVTVMAPLPSSNWIWSCRVPVFDNWGARDKFRTFIFSLVKNNSQNNPRKNNFSLLTKPSAKSQDVNGDFPIIVAISGESENSSPSQSLICLSTPTVTILSVFETARPRTQPSWACIFRVVFLLVSDHFLICPSCEPLQSTFSFDGCRAIIDTPSEIITGKFELVLFTRVSFKCADERLCHNSLQFLCI